MRYFEHARKRRSCQGWQRRTGKDVPPFGHGWAPEPERSSSPSLSTIALLMEEISQRFAGLPKSSARALHFLFRIA